MHNTVLSASQFASCVNHTCTLHLLDNLELHQVMSMQLVRACAATLCPLHADTRTRHHKRYSCHRWLTHIQSTTYCLGIFQPTGNMSGSQSMPVYLPLGDWQSTAVDSSARLQHADSTVMATCQITKQHGACLHGQVLHIQLCAPVSRSKQIS